MWGFLIGAVTSGLLLNNKQAASRVAAEAIVYGEKVVKSAASEAKRIAEQISQDVQDIKEEQARVAEAQSKADETVMAAQVMLARIEQLRDEVATLRSERTDHSPFES